MLNQDMSTLCHHNHPISKLIETIGFKVCCMFVYESLCQEVGES